MTNEKKAGRGRGAWSISPGICSLLLAVSGALAVPCGVAAQDATGGETRAVDIPGGDLSVALEALARQFGVNMIYPSSQLRNFRTAGARGTFTVGDAFRRLVEGTPLQVREEQGAWLVMLPEDGASTDGAVPASAGGARSAMAATTMPTTATRSVDQPLDEVIVTGTYIRRSGESASASPVLRIGRDEVEAHAPRSVADFFAGLPFNGASTFNVGRGLGSTNGSGTLNLRGLGADATLVLLNSRRVARDPVTVSSVDVNALVPEIAISHIEILKDGASSLYGSDAVGGVANLITRNDFDGMDLTGQVAVRETGGAGNYRLSGIWGSQGERTSVMVAAETYRRERYNHESLEVISRRDGSIDAQLRQNGWPARFLVPNRDADGAVTGRATLLADPLCPLFTGSSVAGGEVVRLGEAYPATCVQNVAMGTSANAEQLRQQLFASMSHEFSARLRFTSEVGMLRNRVALADTPGGAVNPAPGQPPVLVPGYAPGNPFRAMSADGALLYAQPSTVQLGYDKDGDGLNDFLPQRDASGAVVLNLGADGIAGTADDAVGGTPFWEDVFVAPGSRIFGLSCNLPGDPASRRNCRNEINMTRAAVDALRWSGSLAGSLAGDWTWQAAFTYADNREDQTAFGSSFSMPALRAALAGFGGAGCRATGSDPLRPTVAPGTAGCEFFNIFGNSVTSSTGSPRGNTRAIGEYVSAMDWSRFRSTAQVVDVITQGSVLQLPAGMLRIAAGAQQRVESWKADYSGLKNRGEDDLQAAFHDKSVRQTARAMFAETSIPLYLGEGFGYLELTGALRHENTAGPGLDTTDPRLGLLYRSPQRRLSLRGTWSTSFLAPSLYQRFRQNAVFSNGVDDYYTPQNDNLARLPSEIRGNPQLRPQKSHNLNLGFSLQPRDGLALDVDYWRFTFRDQISMQNGLAVALDPRLSLDPAKVIRDPSVGTVMHEGVNIGQIVGIELSYVNNARIDAAGVDLGVSHRMRAGAGTLENTWQATLQTAYEVNGVDAHGSRNALLSGASVSVPLRATWRARWSWPGGNVESQMRHAGGFRNDAPPNAGTAPKRRVESFLAWDLAWSRSFAVRRAGLEAAGLALGVNNVLADVPPWVPDGNHTLSTLYDYSGRSYWARLTASF